MSNVIIEKHLREILGENLKPILENGYAIRVENIDKALRDKNKRRELIDLYFKSAEMATTQSYKLRDWEGVTVCR